MAKRKKRDKKASDGNYYRIKKVPIKIKSSIQKACIEEYKFLQIPKEWFYHQAVIEQCNLKEEADWVIKATEKCPYCSNRECSSTPGRKLLFKEWLRGYSEFYLTGLTDHFKVKGERYRYGEARPTAVPFVAYSKTVLINGRIAFDIYQCYKEREKFYLVEGPRSFNGKEDKSGSRFYVEHWEKNKRCPYCNAAYDRLVKEKDFKAEEDILKSPVVDRLYKDTVRDRGIITEAACQQIGTQSVNNDLVIDKWEWNEGWDAAKCQDGL